MRPFQKTETSKLKFALGIGEAGLKMWSRKSKAYKECEFRIQQIKEELRLRGEKVS